jgi:hypothetical protein
VNRDDRTEARPHTRESFRVLARSALNCAEASGHTLSLASLTHRGQGIMPGTELLVKSLLHTRTVFHAVYPSFLEMRPWLWRIHTANHSFGTVIAPTAHEAAFLFTEKLLQKVHDIENDQRYRYGGEVRLWEPDSERESDADEESRLTTIALDIASDLEGFASYHIDEQRMGGGFFEDNLWIIQAESEKAWVAYRDDAWKQDQPWPMTTKSQLAGMFGVTAATIVNWMGSEKITAEEIDTKNIRVHPDDWQRAKATKEARDAKQSRKQVETTHKMS